MEEKANGISYKIIAGRRYRVFKKEFNGSVFYNIIIQQKQYDGTVIKYYRPVTFKRGVVLNDPTGAGVDIIIKSGFENLRANKLDERNPITAIMITDFELCQREEEVVASAYADFKENLDNIEIGEDEMDLPF